MTTAARIEAEWLALLRPAMHCYTPEHLAALLYVAWIDVDAARKEVQ